jgi:hypothetical protein
MNPSINDVLQSFLKRSPDLKLRKFAERHQALPAFFDVRGLFMIKPEGIVISVSWDEPDDVRVENEIRIQNIVRFAASKRYPELGSLAPVRTPHAVVCPHCGGTGVPPELPGVKNVTCFCGGLGWLP